MRRFPSQTITGGAFVLLASATAFAQQSAPIPGTTPPTEPGTLNRFFNGALPEAIGKSKISLNVRPRYEWADQDSAVPAADLKESNAFTVRSRFGLATAPLYGFQAMLEGENVSVLGPTHNFNAAGSNPGGAGRTIVADPPTTELNQAWLSYSNWNSVLKGGRQRIVLDNHRFIGDVGWRQNQQTYDAAALESKPLENFFFFYSYLFEVNRVFGDVNGLPAPNTDFDSDSHILNLSYNGLSYGKITAYTYLLELENASPASRVNSTATYGGFVAGSIPAGEKVKLDYRGEFAWQTDYSFNPADYSAEYYNLELAVNLKPFAFGGGYEVLGSDNSQGFKTPLATLHAFNGWADVFLNTPAAGLQDIYGFAQVTLPYDVPLRLVYHKFNAESGGADFGQELDVMLSKKFGKHWTALAKYAYYDGKDAPFAPAPPVDVQRFWLQLEFNL